MAHFAKLDDNNVVLEVHCVHNNELLVDGVESEAKGIEFLIAWSGGYTNWKQTSYNGNFRKNYAGSGYTYQADIDAFVAPQPYASWTLDANAQWQPPVAKPTDDKMYSWNETNQTWVEITA
ncbi:hypothetical protein UFOVP382_4 [uncultured Caudovirales phage]|uniref:Uncharacterized protein n=1 Tax=uncultured Caudovirales phage TaxID=2100421 RepID=A0A6J7X229_9CAUD|nr:hypothetical protein UFOVP382_4 [uncultured Caudovirales phage]